MAAGSSGTPTSETTHACGFAADLLDESRLEEALLDHGEPRVATELDERIRSTSPFSGGYNEELHAQLQSRATTPPLDGKERHEARASPPQRPTTPLPLTPEEQYSA